MKKVSNEILVGTKTLADEMKQYASYDDFVIHLQYHRLQNPELNEKYTQGYIGGSFDADAIRIYLEMEGFNDLKSFYDHVKNMEAEEKRQQDIERKPIEEIKTKEVEASKSESIEQKREQERPEKEPDKVERRMQELEELRQTNEKELADSRAEKTGEDEEQTHEVNEHER